MSHTMEQRLLSAREVLRARLGDAPAIGMVLGSGFAKLADELEQAQVMAYGEIPGFPVTTNPSHPGRLVVGRLWGQRVAVLQGRIHLYEGVRADEAVVAVRTLALWGTQAFVLTNAAGAINPGFHVGQLMAITDHLNFMGQNPLCGKNLDVLGPRFPDLSTLYDPKLIDAARHAAEQANLPFLKGVYGAMLGPSYETPAEIRMLGILGADAVGMSTVPEAIALGHMGRRVFALSCLSNLAAGLSRETLRDEDIVNVLDRPATQSALRTLLKGVFDALR